MNNGWDESAQAWIASMGQNGDWGRQHVLDPVMIGRATARKFTRALDVGCGEGRFCRLLRQHGIATVGIDPTRTLLDEAKKRDAAGEYRVGKAEQLEFDTASFDLVVSYLSLVDIADYRTAIQEMARVLQPNGTLLVANLTSFITPCADQSWVKNSDGTHRHYPLDRYLDEFPLRLEWAGISIQNWHRPLSAYMKAFMDCGLQLSYFEEPEPISGDPVHQADYRRAPWHLVMEWRNG